MHTHHVRCLKNDEARFARPLLSLSLTRTMQSRRSVVGGGGGGGGGCRGERERLVREVRRKGIMFLAGIVCVMLLLLL